MEDYEGNTNRLLKALGITFEARYISNDCPNWCDNPKHIHGAKYRCIFHRKGNRPLFITFWNSYNDKQNKVTPTAYDVLACITKSEVGTFEDFISEFGYERSTRARAIYRNVVEEYNKVINFFKPEELPIIQEIA